MPTSPLKTPAGYVPQMAISFADQNGDADLVRSTNPLPVTTQPFTAAAALTGSATSTTVAGPFAPRSGRAVVLALSGSWVGQVRVLRSTDGGATKLPLTAAGLSYGVFTANACEAVWEESESAATLYLDVTLSSGTLNYRMGQ